MKTNKYTILNTSEYEGWFEEESEKSKVQIRGRLSHIRESGHLGDHKGLSGDVWELRWKNGRRLYYTYILEERILLLLGGNKNGQSKDITQAKKILSKYVTRER